jgi:ATP-dependent 26S proteasome regulatory subunit
MSSNVDVSEVQRVQFSYLCGVDEIVAALEDNIILPLENLALAKQLGLTPKRGVMLAGPPGTGKTTIGRALAHRLRGKFFLIDGTVISGTDYFYHQISSVFRRAMANAPSIVFIDDSDVIFDSGKEHGLYRYLLTILDGLESERSADVCVMMTAMELGNIPPALVRSGRIELWLEMKLPDADSRRILIQRLFADLVRIDEESAWPAVLEHTSGFTGADLKRLVQDAKLKMAVDMSKERAVLPFHEYLLRAAKEIQLSRSEYAHSAAKAMQVNSDRPRWFNVHPELFETSPNGGNA